LLPAGLVGTGAWCLWSFANRCQNAPAFLSARSTGTRPQARTALRGFKEEFDAWRASLSPEEQTMIQAQAEGEFNKKFRKSDVFKKNLPEEKVQAFTKILEKFFEAEAEDYKKEEDAKTPDYEGLSKKASEKRMDFSLKNKIVQVNRDADRRYAFAKQKINEAKDKGEAFPQSSPLLETWVVKNDDKESHEMAVKVMDWIKKAGEHESATPETKELIQKTVARGVPEMGKNIELLLPQVITNQIHHVTDLMKKEVAKFGEGKSKEEMDKFIKEKVPEIGARVIAWLVEKYITARDEVEQDVVTMKNFYRSQKDMPGKTKADVLKEIWEELGKVSDKPVPPLDEEMLAELAEEPAIIEGEFKHNWGTADILYKSEAIDAFGAKYLLGVFETKDEAKKAFEDWNGEFEKARGEMKAELEQWGKQEQARLDRDIEGQERIKEVLEGAKR